MAFKNSPKGTRSTQTAKPAAKKDSDSVTIFKANLPRFQADIRGNVVADGESFTSKAGKDYYSFRVAYTRMKGGEKQETMFVKVIMDDARGAHAMPKGAYIRVTGAYSDELGEYKGEKQVYRTLFMGDDDVCEVLIAPQSK